MERGTWCNHSPQGHRVGHDWSNLAHTRETIWKHCILSGTFHQTAKGQAVSLPVPPGFLSLLGQNLLPWGIDWGFLQWPSKEAWGSTDPAGFLGAEAKGSGRTRRTWQACKLHPVHSVGSSANTGSIWTDTSAWGMQAAGWGVARAAADGGHTRCQVRESPGSCLVCSRCCPSVPPPGWTGWEEESEGSVSPSEMSAWHKAGCSIVTSGVAPASRRAGGHCRADKWGSEDRAAVQLGLLGENAGGYRAG